MVSFKKSELAIVVPVVPQGRGKRLAKGLRLARTAWAAEKPYQAKTKNQIFFIDEAAKAQGNVFTKKA